MSETPETGAQEAGPEPAGSEPVGSERVEPAPEDDQRRRYREALERKRGRDAGAAGGRRRDGSGGVGPTSNAKSQRMFRRKSG
jgi:hypothetical protein